MLLNPAYQFIPEQSTATIIVHHPQVKYYSIGASRVEQLLKQFLFGAYRVKRKKDASCQD